MKRLRAFFQSLKPDRESTVRLLTHDDRPDQVLDRVEPRLEVCDCGRGFAGGPTINECLDCFARDLGQYLAGLREDRSAEVSERVHAGPALAGALIDGVPEPSFLGREPGTDRVGRELVGDVDGVAHEISSRVGDEAGPSSSARTVEGPTDRVGEVASSPDPTLSGTGLVAELQAVIDEMTADVAKQIQRLADNDRTLAKGLRDLRDSLAARRPNS